MAAGSVTHFILAFVTLWILFVLIGVPDDSKVNSAPASIGSVSACVTDFKVDPQTKQPVECKPGKDPASAASQAGLQAGDVITAINGQPIPNYGAMRTVIRGLGNQDATITYTRHGQTHTSQVHVPAVELVKSTVDPNKKITDLKPDDLERVGMLGVAAQIPMRTFGPVRGAELTAQGMGNIVVLTFESLKQIPEKIPALLSAITGGERDPNTPVSVVGASRIGGELVSVGDWARVLQLFAVLNLFFGIFNLLPLLPMDGGHIAIAWFERVRSWIAARRGRPDPGRVDYLKLTPITLAVISVLGVFVLLTVTADVVNPITLPK
jgi:membrane-associated protease RseP (regulator of RpoE activity)